MFSMGLTLTIEDFKRVSKFPKAFFAGTILQVVVLPAIAFGLAMSWQSMADVEPSILVGLILISACPGGVTSNLMTHLSKGDSALSISLTAIISVLSIITIPFIINLGLSNFMEEGSTVTLPIGKTIVGIFLITTLPVLIGMFVKSKKPSFTKRFEPKARTIATVFFVIIIFAAIVKEWDLLVSSLFAVGPLTLLLNIATMGLAYLVSLMLNLKKAQNRAIVFECGLQNGTLAVTIAITFMNNQEMMIPAGVYSILMFVTGGIYLFLCLNKDRKERLLS